MKLRLIWVQFICLLLISSFLSGCGLFTQNKIENALNWQVEDFSFTDQEGSSFGSSNLKGKVWLADFIFTNCTSVCSPMTAHMTSLQKQLKQKGYDVTFVSFSVDPQRDKPQTLKEFGKKMNVDFSNWHFLTGYSQEKITTFSQNSFKSAVMMDPTSDQVMHGTSFFLVDGTGKIVKRYDGIDDKVDQQLLKDVSILLKSQK